MAVVPWTVVTTPVDGPHLKVVKWAGLSASDTGQPFVVAAYSDKSVQLVNTGGSGLSIEGSLDPSVTTSDWEILNDPQGNQLTALSTDAVENILEHCYQLRPNAAAGVSGATVWLLLASTR